MKAEVKPTEEPEKLVEYLKPRFSKVEREEEKIIVEAEEPEKLGRIPGVDSYRTEDKKKDGLGGKPIQREAFYKIETREDAARAFLATVEGITLYIDTEREWDIRLLKKYNSEIVQMEEEVADELGIEVLSKDFEDVSRNELLAIYDEFLTE